MAATIGVDIGSTSIKAVLVGADGALVRVESRPIGEPAASVPGAHELHPIRIRDTVSEMISALSALQSQTVRALAFTGQMHGGLLLDRGGSPLTPFATWQDQRVPVARLEQWRQRVRGADIELHHGFLAVSAAAWLEAVVATASVGRLAGIYDWVASSLLGTPPAVDPGSAAAWGLYSLTRRAWAPEVVAGLGLDERWLPAVVPSGNPIAPIDAARASALGLAPDAVLVSGAGDTQASYVGSGCQANEVLVNFGTGSQLMWESSGVCGWHGTDVRYLFEDRSLVTVPTLCGGRAYALLADLFGECGKMARDDVYAWMNARAASASAGCDGVVVRPFFNGSRFNAADAQASISGLTRQNFTAANLCRAMLEGMVEELAATYFTVPAEARTHVGAVGSGNGLRCNAVLQEVVRQRFSLPLHLSPTEEEAAVGAARLALMGLRA